MIGNFPDSAVCARIEERLNDPADYITKDHIPCGEFMDDGAGWCLSCRFDDYSHNEAK